MGRKWLVQEVTLRIAVAADGHETDTKQEPNCQPEYWQWDELIGVANDCRLLSQEAGDVVERELTDAELGLRVFEVLGKGYSGHGYTDDRVLWVVADDQTALEKYVANFDARIGDEITCVSTENSEVDFYFDGGRQDRGALALRLFEFYKSAQ